MLKNFLRTFATLAGITLLGFLLTRNMKFWELEILKTKPLPSKPKPVSGKNKKKPAKPAAKKMNSGSINFEKVGKASAGDKDDLKKIKGIGPVLEKKLNAAGIYTYDQIANFTAEDEQQVEEAIAFFPGRIQRDEWVKQAKVLKKK